MQSCEVLIVGGGPAGSSCAKRLVDAGIDVALVDRSRFPRDKVCAGWITPAVVRLLELDVDDYATGRTLQPFTGFRTATLPGRLQLTSFDRPVSYGILRCEFDDYLLRRSGVRRLEDTIIRTVRREEDGWVVDDGVNSIRARVIVGAGGHFCPVAQTLSRHAADVPVIAAQEIEFKLDDAQAARCAIDGQVPELYFSKDLAGYAWCVRKGRYLNIGAGRLAPRPLAVLRHQFTELLVRRGGVLPNEKPRWKGHAYLLNQMSTRPLVAPGALLVGDAAGLALSPSGEGILAAVESGSLAAEVLIDAKGDYSAAGLARYAQEIGQRFGRRAQKLPAVPAWLSAAACTTLLGIPWLTRRVLIESGFLHIRRPAIPMHAC